MATTDVKNYKKNNNYDTLSSHRGLQINNYLFVTLTILYYTHNYCKGSDLTVNKPFL